MLKELEIAIEYAKTNLHDCRNYRLAAAAIREDGTLVIARNISTKDPHPAAHAEYRVSKKLGRAKTVFVARIIKDGSTAYAKPCPHCEAILRAKGVRKVYFTDGPNSWDCMEL